MTVVTQRRDDIRNIFLQPAETYGLREASQLLGMSSRALIREAVDDQREAYRSGGTWRFSWRQLAFVAFRTWTLAEIQDALGKEAATVLPPLLRLRTVTLRLPAFIVCTLETIASRNGTTPDACLHQELMDFAGVWAEEMEASHPGFRRAFLFPGRE